MGRTHMNNEEKARILAWRQEKVAISEICRRTGRAKSTIMLLLAASRGLPPDVVPPNKPYPGRPRKTTKGTDNLLRRELRINPCLTASQLKTSHPKLLADVSVRCIQHRLQKDLGLPSRRAALKPLLTPRMKKQRLDFAKKYKDWTVADWRKVMWSDESTFQCIQGRSTTVRRPSSVSRYDPAYIVNTVKHPESVMIWGCFSGLSGRGGLYFLPKNVTMNADRYITVLEDHLLHFYGTHGCTTFMHDSAPCHKAKKVSKWLADHNIEVLQWPGNSPDLNPIENAWNVMKKKLQSCNTSSLKTLKHEITTVWVKDMPLEYFQNLCDSMPKRLQMVIKAKGNVTKY